ncbi:contact-dependent growth inhibition system immunity protein [Variovorax paradoxus]|uniref:contact-dependent growth inhibition system immunity protein n=1 Tax=Variovorax paradoxus TaxID=34073 RepID=UPI0027805939|nr:contact-dependent growth inhibition system immunity protein [Variovorax paradoxus]MDQ0587209.1 hypothetical protein [Variovorax paradoxus]
MTTSPRYNLLVDLTGIYFGQDADILFGETADAIMASLRETWTADEVQALRTQIVDFMNAHPDPAELERVFSRDFHRSYQPAEFGATAGEFLRSVLLALPLQA